MDAPATSANRLPASTPLAIASRPRAPSVKRVARVASVRQSPASRASFPWPRPRLPCVSQPIRSRGTCGGRWPRSPLSAESRAFRVDRDRRRLGRRDSGAGRAVRSRCAISREIHDPSAYGISRGPRAQRRSPSKQCPLYPLRRWRLCPASRPRRNPLARRRKNKFCARRIVPHRAGDVAGADGRRSGCAAIS